MIEVGSEEILFVFSDSESLPSKDITGLRIDTSPPSAAGEFMILGISFSRLPILVIEIFTTVALVICIVVITAFAAE
jgi:hypothetical protein